jgi:iron complex transport system ATP-binding protein
VTALGIRGLSVAFGEARVLDGIDLVVGEGEWVGVIGPNGAGKTTLLRAIAGLVPADGSVEILGRDAARLDPAARARLVGLVPQRPVTPPTMRVVDYVLLGRTPHLGYLAREGRHDLAAVGEAVAALGLQRFSDRPLGELSGGELQRVVLARALAQASPVLLLDEPTSALDVGHQQQVLALVDRLRAEGGLTIVSAVHDLTLAAQFCDRLVLMSGGRVAANGAARTVLTESTIREHYGASVRILDDGAGGVVVIPIRDSGHLGGPGTISTERLGPAGP